MDNFDLKKYLKENKLDNKSSNEILDNIKSDLIGLDLKDLQRLRFFVEQRIEDVAKFNINK